MKLLFIHQNFPGQFLHAMQAYRSRPDVDVRALLDEKNYRKLPVETLRYSFEPRSSKADLNTFFSNRVGRGQKVAGLLHQLKRSGFTPTVVVGHFGWGETLFVKDVFPSSKLIVHAEYYYSARHADLGFDPEFKSNVDAAAVACARNGALLSALVSTDFAFTPTNWQGSLFPKEFKSKIAIMHEGVQTDVACPNPTAKFSWRQLGLHLDVHDEVITFVNRNLEPYRGYHTFMRALPKILEARPRARVVIVGGDGVSYGAAAPEGQTWKQIFLDEVQEHLPMERVHYVGKIPYPDLIALLQISSVHVYLTYPFVLSWSMLEAMSAGALVIASNTAPVVEVIEDGVNGLLVDFFDVNALVAKVIEALTTPQRFLPLRAAARRTIIERYDVKRCVRQWTAFIDTVAGATGQDIQ